MDGQIPTKVTTRTATRLCAVLVAIALGFGAIATVAGQDAPPASATGNATVSVDGMGIVLVEPDAASIVLGVTSIEDTLTGAQQTATTTMTAILAALESQQVPPEDIQTTRYDVSVLQTFDENGMPVPGTDQFEVSHLVKVILRDVDAVGQLLDAVVQAGANTIAGINFIATDASDAVREARELAVEDARNKAEQLAAAAGLTLGGIVSISERSSGLITVPPTGGDGGVGRAVPIQSGSNSITVDVEMVFELVG